MDIKPSLRKQQGVGLIEVLITLFILAVGLLGVASLQFVGSFANRDAASRTQAEFVAEQVAERLRSAARPADIGDGLVVNNQYFITNNYNFSGLDCESGQPYQCHCLAKPAGIPDCESGICSEMQMSQYDGWALSCSAVQTNPFTQLSVSCSDNNPGDGDTCSAGSRIEVMLTWPIATSENRKSTLNTRCNPSESDSVACVVKDITL